jgi:hypothetical protein
VSGLIFGPGPQFKGLTVSALWPLHPIRLANDALLSKFFAVELFME